MARRRRRFIETTPLGYRVFLTRDRWREIVRFKHPALAGHEADVREAIRDPDIIRSSVTDPDVHLFYRQITRGYVCVIVRSAGSSDRFVVTAYLTRNLKKGLELWTK